MPRNEHKHERREEVGARSEGDDGQLLDVKLDRHCLDPDAPEAVQIPPEALAPRHVRDQDEDLSEEAEARAKVEQELGQAHRRVTEDPRSKKTRDAVRKAHQRAADHVASSESDEDEAPAESDES